MKSKKERKKKLFEGKLLATRHLFKEEEEEQVGKETACRGIFSGGGPPHLATRRSQAHALPPLHVLVAQVVLHLGEVEVLPSASAVNVEHIQAGGLEVGGGIVGLRDEQLVLYSVIRGFVDGGHGHKPIGEKGIRQTDGDAKFNTVSMADIRHCGAQ